MRGVMMNEEEKALVEYLEAAIADIEREQKAAKAESTARAWRKRRYEKLLKDIRQQELPL